MFLKRRTRTKDGKTHVYYSVCDSLRVSRDRVVQRQILHLGELNTTRSIPGSTRLTSSTRTASAASSASSPTAIKAPPTIPTWSKSNSPPSP